MEFGNGNIQPLREGRALPSLHHQALSQQGESSCAAIQQQRQAFESELRMYTGDDPLDVWDRYIRWTLQTYPQGGKESNLTVLLETAVQLFVDDERYSNDSRYVRIWINMAQDSTEPEDIYSYMHSQGIGVTQADLYIAWSEQYEKHSNFQRADAILQSGLKAGAQPAHELQQCHKGLQARASGGTEEAQEGPEEPPPRTGMVDLRPRGRTQTAALVNRGEAPVGPSRGVSLLLPQVIRSSQNAEIKVFDENQMPLRPCSGSLVPSSQPTFQPFVEESDPISVTSMSAGTTAVNMVLSMGPTANKDSAPDQQQTLQTQTQSQEEGRAQEQMYCKELIFRGVIEFSFEELRAERYFKKRHQELVEKSKYLSKVQEVLGQQIEEKQKLLERKSQHFQQPQVVQDVLMAETSSHLMAGPSGTGPSGAGPSGAGPGLSTEPQPFQIYEDPLSGSAELAGNSSQTRNNTLTDDVFLPPGERAFSLRIQYPFPDCKVPDQAQMAKNPPERTEYLTEEVFGHKNKTLCASPEDTDDFARAAKMASSPNTGTLGQRSSSPNTGSLTEHLQGMSGHAPAVTPETDTDTRKKLSPIQETTLEGWSSMASAPASVSSLGAPSGGKATAHLSRLQENHADLGIVDHSSSPFHRPPEAPGSVTARRGLLECVGLRDLQNLHSEPGPLPTVEEDSVLVLGNETYFVFSKMVESESFAIYAGCCEEDVVIKVDSCTVPWDFYVSSRLRERLAREAQTPPHDPGRCFLFQDGCVTVLRAPQQCTLREVSKRWSERCVVSLAIRLVELVRRMHLCSLVHGALNPDTLVFHECLYDAPAEQEGIVAVDLSSALDLELQREVAAAKHVPAAQAYLSLGLLAAGDSPYQVDLVGIAETMYSLLTDRRMLPVKDGSEWTVEEYGKANPSNHTMTFWNTFFRTLLNPGDQPSVAVLSRLLKSCDSAAWKI